VANILIVDDDRAEQIIIRSLQTPFLAVTRPAAADGRPRKARPSSLPHLDVSSRRG
jgi:hypothetical protein